MSQINHGQNLLDQTETETAIFSEFTNGISMLRGVLGKESEELDLSLFDRSVKCAIVGDYKYVAYSDGSEQLFEIARDWAETRNLVGQKPKTLLGLRALLSARLAPFGESPISGEPPPPLDAETRDALRALGYLP